MAGSSRTIGGTFDQTLDQCQPDSKTSLALGKFVVSLCKKVKDMGQNFRRNTDPVVFDANSDPTFGRFDVH